MTTVASRKSSHQTTLLSSLPQEIIDVIATNLTPQELAHCLCVIHEWFDTFTPSLWRAIRVVDETIYDRFRTKETRDALARNSHHIRVVETTDPTFAFFLATLPSTAPTNLQSLTLRLLKTKQQFAFSTDDLTQQQCQEALITMIRTMIPATVTQLLLRNRNLHVLILDEGCFRNEIGDKTDQFFKVLTAVPFTHLERLEISFMGAQPLDNSRVGATLDARDRYREEFMEAIHLHADNGLFLALREVAISGADDTIMDHTRLSFLVRCPNVERIRLDRLDLPSAITIPLMLKNTCPKLTCLDLNDGNSIRSERVLDSVDLVRATALGWRELRLPDMPQFGASAFEALMESVETLEVLRIEGAGQLGTNAVLNLLCSAKNLRRLEGVGDGRREIYTKELTVFAKSAYLEYCNGGKKERSWTLGPSVEYFQLRINGIPRPDVWFSQNGQFQIDRDRDSEDMALSCEVQRWIYTQLGRMTGLRELVLGATDFSPKMLARHGLDSLTTDSVALERILWRHGVNLYNYECLEFSLKSGLELLAGLKELQLLDVRMMAHDIRVEELEWMYRNWPKLIEIRGLDSGRRWASGGVDGVGIKVAVDKWMDAHNRGIGCSFYS